MNPAKTAVITKSVPLFYRVLAVLTILIIANAANSVSRANMLADFSENAGIDR